MSHTQSACGDHAISRDSARRTFLSTDFKLPFRLASPFHVVSPKKRAPSYQLSLGAGRFRNSSTAGFRIANHLFIPTEVGCSASLIVSGTISDPSGDKNAEDPSQYPTLPPLPSASAFSLSLTSWIARECTPGWEYLLCAEVLGDSRVAPYSAYPALSPGAGGVKGRPARSPLLPSASPGPRGRIPVSNTRVPGNRCSTSRTTARMPRKVSAALSLSRPKLLVPTHTTTTPGGCRKWSSPFLMRQSRCCVRSPLTPNALASRNGNQVSKTTLRVTSSS
mmetsp:Transcript_4923/g.16409  ORF Transcript_4923/g.16409 Transcript_4923/m.16409 type:complete len:278 (-) Transcript_4923:362-1195(-)